MGLDYLLNPTGFLGLSEFIDCQEAASKLSGFFSSFIFRLLFIIAVTKTVRTADAHITPLERSQKGSVLLCSSTH